MSYGVFAQYYDALTKNVNYEEMADYLCALLEREGHKAGLTLDLACGTGSLTLALAKRGIDVYGADASMEMLSVAQEKAAEEGLSLTDDCAAVERLGMSVALTPGDPSNLKLTTPEDLDLGLGILQGRGELL